MLREPAPNLLLRLTERPFNLAVYAVFLIAAIWFMVRIVVPSGARLTHGFGAYYSASRLLYSGDYSERVYERDFFQALVLSDSFGEAEDIWSNSPANTLMLLPLAGLPIRTARELWTAVNVVLLICALSLLVWTLAPRAPLVLWLLIFTVALLFRPVISNFVFGQAYVLMFLLLVVAVIGIRRQGNVIGGLSLGLALSLKLVGWPLTFLLIWLRRWRYLAVYALTVILIALASLPIFGLTSWRGFIASLLEMTSSPLICVTAYQTTRSWLCHVLAPDILWQTAETLALPWFAMMLLIVAGAVALVLSLALASRERMAAAAALIAWGVLFAPLGEEYHQVVMLVPIIWLIVSWWSGYPIARVSLIFLMIALILYMVPFPINHPKLQQGWLALLAYPRLYAAWLVWLSVTLSSKWQYLAGSVYQQEKLR
jgi:hypothetical protein